MPLTPDDINAVAQAVWFFNITGTNAHDRLQGIDEKTEPGGSLGRAIAAIPTTPPQPVDADALAQKIVAAIEALPAPDAQKVAALVLAGLDGAKLSVATPTA